MSFNCDTNKKSDKILDLMKIFNVKLKKIEKKIFFGY